MNGYKSFSKSSLTNQGVKLIEGKIYTTQTLPIAKANGYHYCQKLEDTLRYNNGLEEEIIICQVKAVGHIAEYYDEWYGYEIYSTDKLYIEKILSREDIINYANKLDNQQFIRFIQGFKLTKEELEYFYQKYESRSIMTNYLKYYQEKDLEIFNREYKKLKR